MAGNPVPVGVTVGMHLIPGPIVLHCGLVSFDQVGVIERPDERSQRLLVLLVRALAVLIVPLCPTGIGVEP